MVTIFTVDTGSIFLVIQNCYTNQTMVFTAFLPTAVPYTNYCSGKRDRRRSRQDASGH